MSVLLLALIAFLGQEVPRRFLHCLGKSLGALESFSLLQLVFHLLSLVSK